MAETVRIGVIGAGGWSIARILPNFQKVAGAELVSVANRRRETAQKVADKFNIPTVANDFHEVLADPNVDAVFIGTPPYSHLEMTVAALNAGKHVLCQTRISNTADEARQMAAAAQAAAGRGIKTALVPPGPFFAGRAYIAHLIQQGYVGRLTQVMGFNMNDSFADPTIPLSSGRTDPAIYGPFNALQLGLNYDVMVPWTGPAKRVLAQQTAFTPQRPETPDGPMAPMPYPEEVTAIAETESGAVMTNVINWAARFASSRMEVYGDAGTLIFHAKGDKLFGAQKGDADLKELPIPAEFSAWTVEEEFVKLVRGEVAAPSFTFADGVRNMQYLEAVHASATQGAWVTLG